jgi:hypothetical protein
LLFGRPLCFRSPRDYAAVFGPVDNWNLVLSVVLGIPTLPFSSCVFRDNGEDFWASAVVQTKTNKTANKKRANDPFHPMGQPIAI